jgi:hypothetical protein
MQKKPVFMPLLPKKSGSVPATQKRLSVSLKDTVRHILANPGDYACRVEKAELVESRRRVGNVSVVLELTDPASGEHFDHRPMWIAGPNADRGNMVARNQAILADLLSAIGVPEPDGIDDTMLARLVGTTFDLTLGIKEDRAGEAFNKIVRVNGVLDTDAVKAAE